MNQILDIWIEIVQNVAMAAAARPPNTTSAQIRRAGQNDFAEAWQLLTEYFEEIHVVVRDNPDNVRQYLHDPRGGIWIAYAEGRAAGCIALRPLPSLSGQGDPAGEMKRLYVRPAFRRMGIAARLVSAVESYASSAGMRTLYLDSKDDLREAIAFYKRAGYLPCERYNDNPQATVFLTKSLPLPVAVREFRAGDESAFWSLNEAWISKLFKLEEKDIQTLRHPREYILSKGGHIYMACRGENAVGCCALLDLKNGSYEVAKMGVAESERGQGVGRAVLQHAIEEARKLGIRRLYLETNHTLKNAIHLYESAGFKHLKPEDVTPSPYARADVYMELYLAGPGA